MRFLVPATTSPGRAPLGCGPSVPAAAPPLGSFTPPAVSRQAQAGGDVSRRCRPGPLPVQSLPLARSTFTPLGAAASLAVGHRRAWCDVRSLDPPGFPDARVHSIALMGATWTWWPGSPRGSCVRFHVTAFEGGRVCSAPSGPYAGITRHFTSSLGLGALLRARVRSRATPVSRRRAAAALLGVAPPEPSSGPVLGPFVPRAVTPRVRSSFTMPRVANPGHRG